MRAFPNHDLTMPHYTGPLLTRDDAAALLAALGRRRRSFLRVDFGHAQDQNEL